MNDDKYLYLCMTSWDQTITSKIMHMGFTAWFETKIGKGKPMGIHYPIGMAKSGFRRDCPGHRSDEGKNNRGP